MSVKYVSWTDKERELVRHFVDVAIKAGKTKKDAFVFASKKLGRTPNACYGAYNYIPKSSKSEVVTPEESTDQSVVEETKEGTLNIKVHNDINNQCLVIDVNESVTILKIGDVIVTLEVC